MAYVKSVVGEFYWRVNAGDVALTEDYIAPPYMLSFEKATTATSKEIVVSHSKYIDIDTLESAFGLKDLPRPWGIGTIQPQAPLPADFWWILVSTVTLLIVIYNVYSIGANPEESKILMKHLVFAMMILAVWPAITLVTRSNFEKNRWSNSNYSPYDQDE